MREISIKAFTVAQLAFLVIEGVALFFIAAALGVSLALLPSAPEDFGVVAANLKSSSLFGPSVFVAACLPAAIGAGYVAGRVAGSSYLLNGALSPIIFTFFNVEYLIGQGFLDMGDLTPSRTLAFLASALLCGLPAFGILGGRMAQKRDALRAESEASLANAAGAPN